MPASCILRSAACREKRWQFRPTASKLATWGPSAGIRNSYDSFAREALGLTGCEGTIHLDGQETAVSKGDMLRASPSVARGFCAGQQDLCLICIQAEEGSLEQATREDGFLLEAKASWMA